MKKIIALSIFALGSLTMFASEKPIKTENKIELIKEDQASKFTCYHFKVYKRLLGNGGPQTSFLVYEEYGSYASYDDAQNRMSQIAFMYSDSSPSYLYYASFNTTSFTNCLKPFPGN